MNPEQSVTLMPGTKLDFSQILTKTVDVEPTTATTAATTMTTTTTTTDVFVAESSSKKRGRRKQKVVTIVVGETKQSKKDLKLQRQRTTVEVERAPTPSLSELVTGTKSEAADSSSSDFEPLQKNAKRQLEDPEPSQRRSSQRIKKGMDVLVKRQEQQRLLEQELDELEGRAKKRRKVAAAATPLVDVTDVAVENEASDDEVQVEKIVITPQKKSNKKLAPIFVMGKKANPIKVIEDPAKTAARLAFLHSSVPQTLRNQMVSNKVSNFQSFSIPRLRNSSFLSAAIGQRLRNYLNCCCCSCCSPFGSFPH